MVVNLATIISFRRVKLAALLEVIMIKTIQYLGRSALPAMLLFFVVSALWAGPKPMQVKRQGFIYDEKGKVVEGALMKMKVFYKKNKDSSKISTKLYETVSNDMGLYYFNIFLETSVERIVAIRISWANYASLFPQKVLKYTPGLNPHWEFTSEFIDNKYAEKKLPAVRVRDIRLVSMENPIPDKKARTLARRHAPILVFDDDKDHLPTNIEKFFYNYTLEEYAAKGNKPEGRPPFQGKYMRFPDLSKYKKLARDKRSFLYAHVRPLPTYYTGRRTGRLQDFRPHYYWYEENPQKWSGYVISYWFWYDRTEGPSYLGNSHQGGFGGAAVYLDSKMNPQRILTIGHGRVLVDTSWRNVNTVQKHPILYVASGFWSDGSNVTIPSIPVDKESFDERLSIPVEISHGFVDFLGFAHDKFPALADGDFQLLYPGHNNWGPSRIDSQDLKQVKLGDGRQVVDFSTRLSRTWQRLVLWEEPGWVNEKADKDPDGHHKVAKESAFYMDFAGRLGRHPVLSMSYLPPQYRGQSPVNVPFVVTADNIFVREYPKRDRTYYPKGRDKAKGKEHYGPFWRRESVPQKK